MLYINNSNFLSILHKDYNILHNYYAIETKNGYCYTPPLANRISPSISTRIRLFIVWCFFLYAYTAFSVAADYTKIWVPSNIPTQSGNPRSSNFCITVRRR